MHESFCTPTHRYNWGERKKPQKSEFCGCLKPSEDDKRQLIFLLHLMSERRLHYIVKEV